MLKYRCYEYKFFSHLNLGFLSKAITAKEKQRHRTSVRRKTSWGTITGMGNSRFKTAETQGMMEAWVTNVSVQILRIAFPLGTVAFQLSSTKMVISRTIKRMSIPAA